MRAFIGDENSVMELATQEHIDQATLGAFKNCAPNSGHWTDTSGIKKNSTNENDTVSISYHDFWRDGLAPLLLMANNNGTGSKEFSIDFPRFNITPDQLYSLNFAGFADVHSDLSSFKFMGRNGKSKSEYDQVIEITNNFTLSPNGLDFKHFTFRVPQGIDNGFIRYSAGSDRTPSVIYAAIVYFNIIQGDVTTHEWTPAVEDMATKSDLDALKAEIEQLKQK